jgi:galactokinase
MYGIIMSAIAVGIVMIQIIKRKHLRSIEGKEIVINPRIPVGSGISSEASFSGLDGLWLAYARDLCLFY